MAFFVSSDPRHFFQKGFTLTEMLVAVAVLCVLTAVAAPSYRVLIIDTRMTTEANKFLSMLHFTRSEAVKRNTRVTMCKSSDGTSCTTSGSWNQGWIIFVDGSIAGTRDPTDELLRVHGALSKGSALIGNQPVVNYVSYISNGQTRMASGAMQGGTLKLCSGVASTKGRNIVIATGPGRPRVNPDYPDC